MVVDYYDRRTISACSFICCCSNCMYKSMDVAILSVLLQLLIILPTLNWRAPSPGMQWKWTARINGGMKTWSVWKCLIHVTGHVSECSYGMADVIEIEQYPCDECLHERRWCSVSQGFICIHWSSICIVQWRYFAVLSWALMITDWGRDSSVPPALCRFVTSIMQYAYWWSVVMWCIERCGMALRCVSKRMKRHAYDDPLVCAIHNWHQKWGL